LQKQLLLPLLLRQRRCVPVRLGHGESKNKRRRHAWGMKRQFTAIGCQSMNRLTESDLKLRRVGVKLSKNLIVQDGQFKSCNSNYRLQGQKVPQLHEAACVYWHPPNSVEAQEQAASVGVRLISSSRLRFGPVLGKL